MQHHYPHQQAIFTVALYSYTIFCIIFTNAVITLAMRVIICMCVGLFSLTLHVGIVLDGYLLQHWPSIDLLISTWSHKGPHIHNLGRGVGRTAVL